MKRSEQDLIFNTATITLALGIWLGWGLATAGAWGVGQSPIGHIDKCKVAQAPHLVQAPALRPVP